MTILVLLCLFGLTACQFKTKWRDTTSSGRTQQQAQSDARECYDLSGYAALDRNSTSGDFEAFKAKLDACMAGRGWELVRDNGQA